MTYSRFPLLSTLGRLCVAFTGAAVLCGIGPRGELTAAREAPLAGPSVVLELILPSGEKPRLTTAEGYTAVAHFEPFGRLGITASQVNHTAGTATINILDASETPMKPLEDVKLVVARKAVELKTRPPLAIGLLRIEEPK